MCGGAHEELGQSHTIVGDVGLLAEGDNFVAPVGVQADELVDEFPPHHGEPDHHHALLAIFGQLLQTFLLLLGRLCGLHDRLRPREASTQTGQSPLDVPVHLPDS